MTQFSHVKKVKGDSILKEIQFIEALYHKLDDCGTSKESCDSSFSQTRSLTREDVTLMSDVESLLVSKFSYDLAKPVLEEMVAFVSRCTLIKDGRTPK
jgi:hypothetical protein